MTNPYGPWATAIDAGRNPQLSAFWKQRMSMLVPASRTSPVLSRREMLGLIGVGVATCSLPMIRGTSAWAEPPKHAEITAKEVLAAWRKRQASIESFQYHCRLKD